MTSRILDPDERKQKWERLMESGDVYQDEVDAFLEEANAVPVKLTLDEFRAEMRREAAEKRLMKRIEHVNTVREKKKAEAGMLARVADAAEFALKRVEGDDDMLELQRHWEQQVHEHRVLVNEATAPIDCYISLTHEEEDVLRVLYDKKQITES